MDTTRGINTVCSLLLCWRHKGSTYDIFKTYKKPEHNVFYWKQRTCPAEPTLELKVYAVYATNMKNNPLLSNTANIRTILLVTIENLI